MTTVQGDRWAGSWQMNEDPKKILEGLEDRSFTLRRSTTSGPNVEYDFIHKYVGAGDDPFEHTKLRETGSVFLAPPVLKLKAWKNSEATHYDQHVRVLLGSKPANMKKLTGKKIFGGQPETLTLYVLPQAISKFGEGAPYMDLIVVTCEVDGPHIEQDGTAHGNPK